MILGSAPCVTLRGLLAIALLSARLDAQRPGTDPIPRDLAGALISEGSGAAIPDFFVGTIPPMLAERIPTLPGARILGSMLTSIAATIAMEVPISADSVRTLVMKELVARGWRPAATPTGAGGGFRPAAARSPSGYCGDGRMLTFSLSTRAYGTTLLRYVVRDPDNFMCPAGGANRERVSFVTMSGFGYNSVPVLVNPRDVLPPTATCRTQGSGFGQIFSASVRVAMTPEELMNHYVKQLTDSGFAAQDPAAGVRELSRTLMRRTPAAPNGPPSQTQVVTVRMAVSPAEPECRMMRLESSSIFDR